MKIVNLEKTEIETFLNELGVAFGGRSQLTWKIIGAALRSRVSVAWYNVNISDAIDKIIDSEFEFWGWEDHLRTQTAAARSAMIQGYNSHS